MNCREWTSQIVENSRSGSLPGAQLESHIKACRKCAERWQLMQALNTRLVAARAGAAGQRSSAARREEMMRRFAMAPRPAFRPSLRWVLAAAALLLFSIGVGYVWQNSRHAAPSVSPTVAVTADVEEISGDSSGFVAVAYAPPLEAGELVSVLRMELQPSALARMGIYVDALYADAIPADVVLGEDGFPRAVRVIAEASFEN